MARKVTDKTEPDDHSLDLARWLVEAGRRRIPRKADGGPDAPAAARRAGRYVRHPRELTLFAIAAAAYLPYYFADVYVQIYSMHSLIVFV
jgi:hypothetical protein